MRIFAASSIRSPYLQEIQVQLLNMQRFIWLQVFLLEVLLSHAFVSDFLPKRSQAVSLDRLSLSSNAIHGTHHRRRMVAARSVSDINKRTSSLDKLFKKHLVLRFAHGQSVEFSNLIDD